MFDSDSGKSEKVLIIEGDGALGERIASALKADGYSNVTLVKNGTDGLKAIYSLLPHLVLLDVTLPDIDGYTILAKKQEERLLARIPIFLLSMQGVPINMRKVPDGSVAEYMMALHADPALIVEKVNKRFRHSSGPVMQTPTGQVNGNGKKILWVEDDKLIGMILAKKVISAGFNLIHAKDGDEAIKALQENIPDAIVVDLLLPSMSGFDILQNIRADERLKNVPTMVLSNLSKPSDIEKAKTLGAKKFLVKAATPIDQIVAEIKDLCR